MVFLYKNMRIAVMISFITTSGNFLKSLMEKVRSLCAQTLLIL